MQGTAAALHGRGPDLSAAIAELDPFAEETNRLLRVLDTQQLAVRQLIRDGGDVFQALSERQGQLRGLIQNSDAVFPTTARRNADLAQTCSRSCPPSSASHAPPSTRLNSFAREHRPARAAAPAGRAAAQPDPDRGREGRARPEGVLRRAAGDDQRARTPASRRSAGC